VTFTPSQQSQDRLEIRRDDVVCQVVGESPLQHDDGAAKDSKDKIETKTTLLYSPSVLRLKVSFTGTCLQQKPGFFFFFFVTNVFVHEDGESIKFSCPVRETLVKSVPLSLPSSLQANRDLKIPLVLPVTVAGEYFTAPPSVEVGANGMFNLPITYKPSTMTVLGAAFDETLPTSQARDGSPALTPATVVRPHEGSLFIPLADGTGIYKMLEGQALDPKEIDTLSWNVTSHQQQVCILRVPNWTGTTSRLGFCLEFFHTFM
jgi:hypothetical protein